MEIARMTAMRYLAEWRKAIPVYGGEADAKPCPMHKSCVSIAEYGPRPLKTLICHDGLGA